MALSINTNLASLNSQRQQARSQSDLASAIARLSSGLRINSAKDDAAGLAIADRFTAQIRGTTQAGRNANDGISLAQTAEGALASIDDNLQRIRELAVQSANATNSASDRASLQLEVAQLQSEIDRVAAQTQFNGINLLDGSFTAKQFQVGANVGQTVAVASISSARSGALGVYQGFNLLNLTYGAGPTNAQHLLTLNIGSGPTIALGMTATDAKQNADVVNNAHIPGLSATANVTSAAGVASAAGASSSGAAVYNINGLAIALNGVSGGAALASNRAAAVAAINAQSAATGVFAADNGSAVDLRAPDGRNISLSYAAGSFTGSSAADFGLSSVPVTAATSNQFYVQPPGVSGDIIYTYNGGTTIYSVGTTGTAVSAIDVSTVAGANMALTSIDAALGTVSSARAALGAVQNRFTSTVGNAQSVGENLSASRSRIQDADFAAESAGLARSQVLQQAGTAMLAQANQSTSQVLALLRAGSSS